MRSNKVDHSIDAGVYCTVYDVKVTFCMLDFPSSKIINHHFCVKNYRGELVIGYYIIIARDLMIQLGLTNNFKHQVLQWDGAIVHMKEPDSLLGKYD